MAALAFGRIGCFLNGCCFGKPTNLPWAVRFPYDSPAYQSQVFPDLDRNRPQPYLKLPPDFFGFYYRENGTGFYRLKPYKDLTAEQKYMVDKGPYRCLPVHPIQLYSSINGAVLCFILYLFWRKSRNSAACNKPDRRLIKPGSTFALMFIMYGITRFLIEFLRDDNPFGFDGLTISQNMDIFFLIPLGVVLMVIFGLMKLDKVTV
jgi:phosphatidylglycerol:prolipoprotein diacylglycerol transferase